MKKFSRSIIATLLSISFMGLSVGCGNSSTKTSASKNASGKVTIEFWHYWDGNNGKALNDLVQKFNSENKEIEVKPVFIPGNELNTKIQASIASKTMPAVAAADISAMAKLKSTGKLVDLNKSIEEHNIELKNFYDSLLEYGKQEDKIYSLPVSTNNLALFYNKELFKTAGLDPNHPPKTWGELEKMAQTIAQKIPGTYGFEFYTQVGDSGEGLTWQVQPYLWQSGADFIKDGKAAFNNEQGEKALNFLTGLINKKVSPVGSWDDFAKGKCAMVVDGSWMVGIWKSSLKFDFGTSLMPIPESGKIATNMGGEQIFAFNKEEAENNAATKFISYMVDTNTQIQWDKNTAFMPVRKEVAENKEYLEWINTSEPRLKPFVEQQKYAHARPCIVEYPEISLAFAKEIEKAYYGRVSVKEALKNAEKAVNSCLNK